MSWLFRAISLTVRRKEKTEISLRIFGIPLGKKKRVEAVAVEKEQSKASEESTPGRVTVQPKEESKEEPKEKESGNPMKRERSQITGNVRNAQEIRNRHKKIETTGTNRTTRKAQREETGGKQGRSQKSEKNDRRNTRNAGNVEENETEESDRKNKTKGKDDSRKNQNVSEWT